MARLTEGDRIRIMADFHAGVSQNELAKRYNVSPATINKMCKGISPKNSEKVNALTQISIELADQSEWEVNAIHSEVEYRTRHIKLFNSLAANNAIKASRLPCETHQDHERLSNTILRSKEVVLGKTPDTAVQINNSGFEVKAPWLSSNVEKRNGGH